MQRDVLVEEGEEPGEKVGSWGQPGRFQHLLEPHLDLSMMLLIKDRCQNELA